MNSKPTASSSGSGRSCSRQQAESDQDMPLGSHQQEQTASKISYSSDQRGRRCTGDDSSSQGSTVIETNSHTAGPLGLSNSEPVVSSQDIVQTVFTCEIVSPQTGLPCGKSCKSQIGLTRHQAASIHRPEKRQFQCPRCSKEYVFKTGLRKHMRDKHGYDLDPCTNDEAEEENGSDYCPSKNDGEENGSDYCPSENDGEENGSDYCTSENDEEEYDLGQPKSDKPSASSNAQTVGTDPPRTRHSNDSTVSRPPETNVLNVRSSKRPTLDSAKAVLTCKMLNPRTGKPCNQIFLSAHLKWAKATLKKHQDGPVHHPEQSKAFECPHCHSEFSYRRDFKIHMRKKHGVGAPRTAEFSDEESDSSSDELAVPPPSVISSNEVDIVSADQDPSISSKDDK